MKSRVLKKMISFLLAAALGLGVIPLATVAQDDFQDYLRGVWVATVVNIDFKQAYTEDAIKSQIDGILENAKNAGLNAVFFQVRPTCDALYKSSVFPWSQYLTGTQGTAPENGFDPLTYFCTKGKEMGIAIHAWINPYRVTMSGSLDDLAPNNPARQHPEIVRSFPDGKLYLDPGEPLSQQLVLDGIKELVANYDIAGVHFDDYFYPSSNTGAFPDDDTYAKYGGGLTRDDWRRNNTYTLVKKAHDLVKSIKKDVVFGIAPAGIWRNQKSDPLGSATNGYETYSGCFADTRKWVKDGIIDYIAPQIYWVHGYKAAAYEVLVNWWSDVVHGTKTKLYIGHALYKVGSDANWSDPSEITDQIATNRTRSEVSGSIFYNYSSLAANLLGATDNLAALFGAATPPAPIQDKPKDLTFAYPKSGVTTSYSQIYLIGTANPAIPILLNGTTVNRTANGHFELYLKLNPGENKFNFSYNGKTYTYIANRSTGGSPAPSYSMSAPSFKPGSVTPSSNTVLHTKESLTLSCVAPSGSAVSAKIGNTVVVLKESKGIASPSGLPLASFTASYMMQDQRVTGIKPLGKAVYTGVYKGTTFTLSSEGQISFYKTDPRQLGTILADNTVMRTYNSSNADRLTPLAKGVTDYIVDESPSYYKFRYGGWTLKENVKSKSGTLKANKITSFSGTRDNNYTDIRWAMPVYTPYKVAISQNTVTVTFPSTTGVKAFTMAKSNPLFKSVTFQQSGSSAVYTFSLKNTDRFYGYSVSYSGGKLVFSFRNPASVNASAAKPLSGKTVVVDAGHGGSDAGAAGPEGADGRNEKELNLFVAKALESYLKGKGATVVMTRTKDSSVTLEERAAITLKKKPNVFVSIHHNSLDINYDIKNYTGLLTLYSEGFSKRLATSIQNSMVASLGRKDTGVREEGLFVCRVNDCPTALVELGFISNPYEFEQLSDSGVIQKEAQAIGDGIIRYLVG